MKTSPRYFKLTVMLLFLVVFCTLLMLPSNSMSQYLDSKIATSLQEPSHHESHSNVISASISQSNSSPLSSLSLDTMNNNNDTISVLVGPTLIDGTGEPPKPNAVIIINGNKIVAVTNETEYHHNQYYYSLVNNETTRVNVLNL